MTDGEFVNELYKARSAIRGAYTRAKTLIGLALRRNLEAYRAGTITLDKYRAGIMGAYFAWEEAALRAEEKYDARRAEACKKVTPDQVSRILHTIGK